MCALSAVTESSVRERSHISQVSGSTSDSCGSRPASWPPIIVTSEMLGPKARVNSSSRSGPDQGGVTSSISWPRDSSSAAASRAAASHTGSSAAPSSGGLRARPIRSRPGSSPAASANGRAGGGAQVASPGS